MGSAALTIVVQLLSCLSDECGYQSFWNCEAVQVLRKLKSAKIVVTGNALSVLIILLEQGKAVVPGCG